MVTTEDIFDITPSIRLLEQGMMSLQKALDFLKEGSTEGLLQYFQINVPDGTKHFPSMVTRYEHGIGNTLAKRLEEELLKNG